MSILKLLSVVVLVTAFTGAIIGDSFARGRTGSHRSGGYSSHGKGSHYYGGH
jgi:hypothetical protein